MGIGPLFFMLGALVPLNGWNQIPVSFGSSVQVPALVLRPPPSLLSCVTFTNQIPILFPIIFPNRLNHSRQIFRRNPRLDIMYGVEDETALFAEYFAALQNLIVNLLRGSEG